MTFPDDHGERHRPAAHTTVGVVLAAGAGTRFGSPKIAAREGDWLRRAVHSLAAGGCDQVLVAMGALLVDPPPPARQVVVGDWQQGLSRSVAAGLRAARDQADAAVVVLHVVDTPDVGPDLVRRVLRAAGTRRDALARATFAGRPGHPVVIGTDHVEAILSVLTGDSGAGPYLAAHREAVIDVECSDLATGRDHDVDDDA